MADELDTTMSEEVDAETESQVDETTSAENFDGGDSNDSSNISNIDSASDNEARFARLEATLERVLGEISSIREAQGILVENGAVISDSDTDMDFTDVDSFVPPSEMDLLL